MDDAQDADWIRVQDVENKSIALSQNVDDVLRLALTYQRGH
jgi:hypothetical protein